MAKSDKYVFLLFKNIENGYASPKIAAMHITPVIKNVSKDTLKIRLLLALSVVPDMRSDMATGSPVVEIMQNIAYISYAELKYPMP